GWTDFINVHNGYWASSLHHASFAGDKLNFAQWNGNAAWAPRHGHEVAVFDGKLWLSGGQQGITDEIDDITTRLNDVWFSEDGVNWTQSPLVLPVGLAEHEMVGIDGALLIFGGLTSDGTP